MKLPHWPIYSLSQEIKYNLDNIRKLLAHLNNPQFNVPQIIHIAGTNGKGSSVAMFKAIFQSAGYKVHAYTSPHLISFNERIILADVPISDELLFFVCEQTRLVSIAHGIVPSFFEAITAAAFLAFSQVEADILILETGMGGRLDATNIIIDPIMTLITPISFDHMDYLGSTLSLIAQEKAGIIKPKAPCVISYQAPIIYRELLEQCDKRSSPSLCYEYDFIAEKTHIGFSYKSKNFNYEFQAPSLLGDHQLINAASVIAGISLINKRFNISYEQIAHGLQNLTWPARIEKIQQHRYIHITGPNVQIWLDGAHNNAGAQVFAKWIEDNLQPPIYLILGMTKNRNIKDFCLFFNKIVNKSWAVPIISEPRSFTSVVVATEAKLAYMDCVIGETLEGAIKSASFLNHANDKETNIVICGSLFLAADFLKLIKPPS
jgi:dihydrofolate synthase/folylpolyglutamate synthase